MFFFVRFKVAASRIQVENRSMNPNPRQLTLLTFVRAQGSVTVEQLAEKLGVTLQTVRRDVQRLINLDRNSFAAAMVALGHADGMVTGVTRNFDQALEEVLRVIDPAPGGRVMGMSVVLAKGHTLFIADTNVTEMPDAEDLATPDVAALGRHQQFLHLRLLLRGIGLERREQFIRPLLHRHGEICEVWFHSFDPQRGEGLRRL